MERSLLLRLALRRLRQRAASKAKESGSGLTLLHGPSLIEEAANGGWPLDSAELALAGFEQGVKDCENAVEEGCEIGVAGNCVDKHSVQMAQHKEEIGGGQQRWLQVIHHLTKRQQNAPWKAILMLR